MRKYVQKAFEIHYMFTRFWKNILKKNRSKTMRQKFGTCTEKKKVCV